MNSAAARSVSGRIFTAVVLLAGVGAVAGMLAQPIEEPRWLELGLLTAAACVATRLKFRLPGAQRSISLAILPIFAAIAYQPALPAFFVAAAALLFDSLFEGRLLAAPARAALEVSSVALAVFSAWAVHHYLTDQVGLGWLLSLTFAAVVYYVLESSISAIQIGLENQASPWASWKSIHFWTLPVYLMAPAGVGAARQLLLSPTLADKLSGLFLAALAAVYLKIYLARLRRRASEQAPEAPQTAALPSGTEEAEYPASPQQQALQHLLSAPDRLHAFYQILQSLGADLNFDHSIQQCLRILKGAVPFDKAGIFVRENGQYRLLQAEGLPDHCLTRLSLPTERGVVAQVIETRRPVLANAPPSETPEGHVPRYLDDVRSTLAVPLIAEEVVIGLVVLGSVHANAFHDDQADFLDLIAPKLASTLASSQALQRLYLEAETDEVTNLPNARAAFRKLDAELKRAERQGQSVAVLYVDLDGLKPVNDSYGHAAGDRLLLEIGRKLKTYLRSYDFLARVGGDEFLAIIPGIEQDGLPGKVEALKSAVASTPVMVTEGIHLRAAISIGAALFPRDARDAEELIYLSDRRMYRDKLQSRPGTDVQGLARRVS